MRELENIDGADLHDILGKTGRKTEFLLEEFAAPHYVSECRGRTDPCVTEWRAVKQP